MEAILAIVQLTLVPILLAVALAVRFAGNSKPLNIVDYVRVTDPTALHRWAGTRLLLLPIAFLIGGLASLRAPWLSLVCFGVTTVFCLCIAAWIALGAERFQTAA